MTGAVQFDDITMMAVRRSPAGLNWTSAPQRNANGGA